jgi:ubiquinone/menaquinone biosynthesis C-methylase UbiE
VEADERARVEAEFARRDASRALADRYAPSAPAVVLAEHELAGRLRRQLGRAGLLPLGGRRVLDVGCGSGGLLRLLERLGGRASFAGVDLGADRLASARAQAPHHAFARADGAALPFPDACFDLVCQSTVLSSILDAGARRRIAAEMARVLRPSGCVLWYDFIWNPLNRATHGLGRGELGELFPGFAADLERATLAPPLARLVAPRSGRAARALAALPWLRGHYLGLLRRGL